MGNHMTKTAGISIASLDVRKASETPFEFEYVNSDGAATGLFFKVLGSQSETVAREANRLINERRRLEAFAAAKAAKSRNLEPEYTSVEDDILFGQRLAAVRLVGWRGPGETSGLTKEQLDRFQGIEDPYSADLALQLCQGDKDIADHVLKVADTVGNFTKASPRA